MPQVQLLGEVTENFSSKNEKNCRKGFETNRPKAFNCLGVNADHVNRSDEGLTLETSAFLIFHGGNSTFINSFDKTKLLLWMRTLWFSKPLTWCCCCCWPCRWNPARWCRRLILSWTDLLCALCCRWTDLLCCCCCWLCRWNPARWCRRLILSWTDLLCCCCCWLCRWNPARWCRRLILIWTDLLCTLCCRCCHY